VNNLLFFGGDVMKLHSDRLLACCFHANRYILQAAMRQFPNAQTAIMPWKNTSESIQLDFRTVIVGTQTTTASAASG
jgi:hypothetical protein